MHSCVRANTGADEDVRGDAPGSGVLGDVDASLAYARLRLDLVRLARQLTEKERAEQVVQAVLRYVVRRGPAAPRDSRGLPRPAYMASLVHAFIADSRRAEPSADWAVVHTAASGLSGLAATDSTGARGG